MKRKIKPTPWVYPDTKRTKHDAARNTTAGMMKVRRYYTKYRWHQSWRANKAWYAAYRPVLRADKTGYVVWVNHPDVKEYHRSCVRIRTKKTAEKLFRILCAIQPYTTGEELRAWLLDKLQLPSSSRINKDGFPGWGDIFDIYD